MRRLAREIVVAIVTEYGAEEFFKRISDPVWFQSFGCTLAFDWHSSGLTTTVCGALKEALKEVGNEVGIFMAGGKGREARRTPGEIETLSARLGTDPDTLVYASRMSAKVDNVALQDGYQLYHHTMLFRPDGLWCVIQQGMNADTRYARRYHWLSTGLEDFVCEPHVGIISDGTSKTLNMVADESAEARRIVTYLATQRPETTVGELKKLKSLTLPAAHPVDPPAFSETHLKKILARTSDLEAQNFEELIGIEGVGPQTIRALALVSELVYGAGPSFEDPARYSFAHGGKDGHPFPVDREDFETSITVLGDAVRKARLGRTDKVQALRRLSKFLS